MNIYYHRLARRDYDQSADYFANESDRTLARFSAAVTRILGSICKQPNFYPLSAGEVREARVPKFRFVIYYRILNDGVYVLAIFHTSRDPAEWQSRL